MAIAFLLILLLLFAGSTIERATPQTSTTKISVQKFAYLNYFLYGVEIGYRRNRSCVYCTQHRNRELLNSVEVDRCK